MRIAKVLEGAGNSRERQSCMCCVHTVGRPNQTDEPICPSLFTSPIVSRNITRGLERRECPILTSSPTVDHAAIAWLHASDAAVRSIVCGATCSDQFCPSYRPGLDPTLPNDSWWEQATQTYPCPSFSLRNVIGDSCAGRTKEAGRSRVRKRPVRSTGRPQRIYPTANRAEKHRIYVPTYGERGDQNQQVSGASSTVNTSATSVTSCHLGSPA